MDKAALACHVLGPSSTLKIIKLHALTIYPVLGRSQLTEIDSGGPWRVSPRPSFPDSYDSVNMAFPPPIFKASFFFLILFCSTPKVNFDLFQWC